MNHPSRFYQATLFFTLSFFLGIGSAMSESDKTVRVTTDNQTKSVQQITTRPKTPSGWTAPSQSNSTAADAFFADWDPYQEMEKMKRSMNQIVEQSLERANKAFTQAQGSFASPRLDVREEPNQFVVSVDLPGMDKDKLQISATQDNLTLSGERQIQNSVTNAQGTIIQQERKYGSFERSIPMPANVDPEKITAKYDLGVLTIQLPKKSQAPSSDVKKITVQ